MYTMKQAAGILGISKQGLRYWLDRLGIPHEKGKNGRYVVSDDTLHKIQQAREAKSEVTSEATSKGTSKPTSETAKTEEPKGEARSEAVSEVTSAEAVALAVLREQIAVKDEQIAKLNEELAAKNEQIAEKDRLLADMMEGWKTAQRALVRASGKELPEPSQNAQIIPAEQEPETRTRAGEDQPEEEHHKKRSWLDRILGRV